MTPETQVIQTSASSFETQCDMLHQPAVPGWTEVAFFEHNVVTVVSAGAGPLPAQLCRLEYARPEYSNLNDTWMLESLVSTPFDMAQQLNPMLCHRRLCRQAVILRKQIKGGGLAHTSTTAELHVALQVGQRAESPPQHHASAARCAAATCNELYACVTQVVCVRPTGTGLGAPSLVTPAQGSRVLSGWQTCTSSCCSTCCHACAMVRSAPESGMVVCV